MANTARTGAIDAPSMRGALHDISQGIVTISYLLEIIGTDAGIPPDAARHLTLVREQTDHLLDLVGQTLSGEHRCEAVAVRDLAVSVAATRSCADGTPVTVVPGDECVVVTEPTVVRRIIDNLVDNAVRAVGPDGRIEIAVRRRRDGAEIDVDDDGPGPGAGPPGRFALGLGIASSLAESCGGHLEIQESAAVGTHAHFDILDRDTQLPATSEVDPHESCTVAVGRTLS